MGSIIEQIRSGDKDAVKAVYQEYAKDVYNFAKSITGDHDTALAATKKTFVKLFNNIKKGDEPENIRTALLKIAYDEACSIAMPAKEEADTAKTIVPTPIEETQTPQRPQREEIYMPKGGYDSLQVEDDAAVETAEEIVEEAPRPRRPRPEDGEARPRRPRPAEDGTEEAPRPRKRRPVEDAEETEEEAPRPRKRRPVEETEEIEEEAPRRRKQRPSPVEEPEEIEEEAPRARKKKRVKDEEAAPSKKKKAYDDVDVYNVLDDEDEYDDEYDDEGEYEKPRNKGLFIFCIILNVILILILLWFLGGLLINLGVLPEFDFGYSWFNAHIYPLF